VRSKNILAMLLKNFVAMGIVTITWVLVGGSLAFSGNSFIGDWSVVGNLDLWGLRGLGLGNEVFGAVVPDNVVMGFQLMFAIITPALISGAVAERMKFSAWALFIAVWSVVVYAPMAHWVWGGGFIAEVIGGVDFAGGIVVHVSAGAAALAVILALGPRIGWRDEPIRPHNLTLTLLGAGILWFGWFGFNSGSTLTSDALTGNAFLTTQISAAVAACVWLLAEVFTIGKPTTLGFASGAVAGLVGITPAAGFVGPLGAIAIGAAAGLICFWALKLKFRFGFDDSLDVIAVHVVGSIIGLLLVGVLADSAVTDLVAGWDQLGRQALSIVIAFSFSFVVSYALVKAIDVTMGIRVTEDEERAGLDITLHEEQSYVFGE
ncbi:MAG: ammonium transporter, partial [Dehalococcoidia bacterium]|nr:ammonium transporter [Dehalococcoidia bacterium]